MQLKTKIGTSEKGNLRSYTKGAITLNETCQSL